MSGEPPAPARTLNTTSRQPIPTLSRSARPAGTDDVVACLNSASMNECAHLRGWRRDCKPQLGDFRVLWKCVGARSDGDSIWTTRATWAMLASRLSRSIPRAARSLEHRQHPAHGPARLGQDDRGRTVRAET